MVGTMCMCVTLCRSISRSMSSASKRGCSTMCRPSRALLQAVGGRRRVVHRAVHQHDDRGIGSMPQYLPTSPRRAGLLLGRRGRAAHALGPAGRARGVDHAAARRLGRLGCWARCARRRRPRSRRLPARGASRPARHRRRAISGGVGTTSTFTPAGMPAAIWGSRSACDHQHLGAAVGQDVARLLRREMPVDRHGIGAELARRHVGLEGREVVAQHQRHAVVLADAERGEAAGARARHWPGSRPSCGTARPP